MRARLRPPRVPRALTSRGQVQAHTMIVADSECHAEIKGYLPFTRGGVAGPGTREEHREGQARRGPRGPSAFIPVEEVSLNWGR